MAQISASGKTAVPPRPPPPSPPPAKPTTTAKSTSTSTPQVSKPTAVATPVPQATATPQAQQQPQTQKQPTSSTQQGFNPFQAIQSGFNQAVNVVQNNIVKPVTNVAQTAIAAVTQNVVKPVANFVANTAPTFLNNNVVKPVANFATNTAPTFLNNNVVKPVSNFVTNTAPTFLNNNIVKPVSNFVTQTLPRALQTAATGAAQGTQNAFKAAGGLLTKVGQAFSNSGAGKPIWSLLTHNLGGTNQWNSYDGKLLGPPGANGIPSTTTYKPGMPLNTLPGATPVNGVKNSNVIIYTNGISTDPQTEYGSMQNIANKTGSKVVGNYNATNGAVADIYQTAGDKLNSGNNPAATNLQNMISSELQQGHTVTLMGHSQGAEITARALYRVSDQLKAQGYTDQQIQQKMGNIHVTTFGGASTSYPPGPSYDHYINNNDLVPVAVGLGQNGLPRYAPWNNPGGANVRYHYFTEGQPIGAPGFDMSANHDIDTTYMNNYP